MNSIFLLVFHPVLSLIVFRLGHVIFIVRLIEFIISLIKFFFFVPIALAIHFILQIVDFLLGFVKSRFSCCVIFFKLTNILIGTPSNGFYSIFVSESNSSHVVGARMIGAVCFVGYFKVSRVDPLFCSISNVCSIPSNLSINILIVDSKSHVPLVWLCSISTVRSVDRSQQKSNANVLFHSIIKSI